MSAQVLLRAELIARMGNMKLMVSAPHGVLPVHYRAWKQYRNKEDIQFLHVLPCRCGFVRSNSFVCTCSGKIDLASLYKDRNRRHFYEEGYSLYLDASNLVLDEYETLLFSIKDQLKEVECISVEEMPLSLSAKEILQQAKKRFSDCQSGTIEKVAAVIETINRASSHKKTTKRNLFDANEISKASVLEALSFRFS